MALIAANLDSAELDSSIGPLTQAALHGITRALASVGRAFVCLDPSFRIVHASDLLDELLGAGTSNNLRGRPVDELLGIELFGPCGPLRQALSNGQMREGWRATLKFGTAPARLVSITTAPMLQGGSEICDPRVMYLVLLRPAEEEEVCPDAPTFCSGAVACSPAMQRIFRLVDTLQHSEATVLITGESGTGKEVVAPSPGIYWSRNCLGMCEALLQVRFGTEWGGLSSPREVRSFLMKSVTCLRNCR